MTFCVALSASEEGNTVASGAVRSSVAVLGTSAGSSSAGFSDGAGVCGVVAFSSEARMREIGGKTVRFGFTSPSSVFLAGVFRSMSETLSASRVERRAISGVDEGTDGVPGLAVGPTSSFIFCFGSFAFPADGLRAAGPPRAAGLRVAVLLLVFVAIVVRLKFCSWPELP